MYVFFAFMIKILYLAYYIIIQFVNFKHYVRYHVCHMQIENLDFPRNDELNLAYGENSGK